MIPTSTLFYKIVSKYLGENSSFLVRGISKVNIVNPGDKEEAYCKTLCVNRVGVISINKEFWNKYIKTEEDAAFVLLHELMHVSLGDTTKTVNPLEADLVNFCMDIRINALVYSLLVNYDKYKNYDNLFTNELYKDKDYTILSHSSLKETNKFFNLHTKLYDCLYYTHGSRRLQGSISEEGIRNTIKQLIPISKISKAPLLGSHGQDQDSKEKIADFEKSKLAEELLKYLGEVGNIGRSLKEMLIDIVESNKSIKLDILKKFTISSDVNKISSFFHTEEIVPNVIPIRPSKSDLAQVSMGRIPIFWHNKEEIPEERDSGCGIYLDVSGSLIQEAPRIISLFKKVKANLSLIYTFSNKVFEQSTKDLLNGNVLTTGGTDFNCIIEHAVEKKHKKFIVITDGYSSVSQDNKLICKDKIKDVGIILTKGGEKNNFFSLQYNKTFELEKLIK